MCRVPSACTVCRVCYFLFDAAKCASSRITRQVSQVSQRELRVLRTILPGSRRTYAAGEVGQTGKATESPARHSRKARALLAVVLRSSWTRACVPRRATMAMPWVTAERPQRWEACYRWFKESWTSAVVGDALRYAPVHYAELCPLDREPYLQPAQGRPPRKEGTAAAASVLGQLAGRTVLFNGDSISVQH